MNWTAGSDRFDSQVPQARYIHGQLSGNLPLDQLQRQAEKALMVSSCFGNRVLLVIRIERGNTSAAVSLSWLEPREDRKRTLGDAHRSVVTAAKP